MANILIIDDNEELRSLWADVLEEDGHDVLTAQTGMDGVTLALEEPVQVIITDVLMPDKDGIETLLEIKAAKPDAKVIVVSGGGMIGADTFLETAAKLGASATMQKPIDIDELCTEVTRLARLAA